MKKYSSHTGLAQQGPFDIEDLKEKDTDKKTSVSHGGIDNWASGGKVDELREILMATPPPLFGEPNVLPVQMPTLKKMTGAKLKKKNWFNFRMTFITISVFLIVGGLVIVNNPDAIAGVKFAINTPKPIVVTSRADDSKSDLLKAGTTVYATVLNKGGEGNVLVTFHVYQDNNSYYRTKQVYLRSNESQGLEVTFDELRILGGEITFHVNADIE